MNEARDEEAKPFTSMLQPRWGLPSNFQAITTKYKAYATFYSYGAKYLLQVEANTSD